VGRVAGSKIKLSPTPNCAGGRGPGGRCENKRWIGACSKLAHLADAGRRWEDKPDWRPYCAAKTWSRRYSNVNWYFCFSIPCPSDSCSAGKYPGGGYMALEQFFVSARTNKRHHHHLVPCNKPCRHSAAKTEQPKASTGWGCSLRLSLNQSKKGLIKVVQTTLEVAAS